MSSDMVNPFNGSIKMNVEGYSGRDIDFLSSHVELVG